MVANGTVFDPTMTDIDVYLAKVIPEFDGYDQASDGGADVDVDQLENIRPSADDQKGVAAEKIGKIEVASENVLQTATKRIRLNNGYVDKPIANEQVNRQTIIEALKNRNENNNRNDRVDGMESNSLDGISTNIAAELMKKFALAEETLKHLVNQRLEKVLSDERAIHKRQMDAMKHELDDARSQLQKSNTEKLELQQIADRRNGLLEKRDRQLAQAHLDYNDLMMELHNAKYLCDACGKKQL